LSDTAGIMDTQLLAILKFSFELITKENELLKEEIKQLKDSSAPTPAPAHEPTPIRYTEQDVKNIYQISPEAFEWFTKSIKYTEQDVKVIHSVSPEAFDWMRKHDRRRKAMIASAVAILQNELNTI
jgi:hypothetical protein